MPYSNPSPNPSPKRETRDIYLEYSAAVIYCTFITEPKDSPITRQAHWYWCLMKRSCKSSYSMVKIRGRLWLWQINYSYFSQNNHVRGLTMNRLIDVIIKWLLCVSELPQGFLFRPLKLLGFSLFNRKEDIGCSYATSCSVIKLGDCPIWM